jgi:hypothetical protein
MNAPIDELKAQTSDEDPEFVINDGTEDTEIPDDEQMGEMFDFAEYELEVGRTTATDEHTGEQYTLWRVEGRPVGTTVDGFREVSPTLPEAVMGVCEALRRNGDDL